jgi:hypothetical protein
METYARSCPLGTLDETDAASLQLRRVTDMWRAASRSDHDFWKAPGLDWTVVLGTDLEGITGAGNRSIRVVPTQDLKRAVDVLRPIAGHLQNVGLGATGSDLWATAETLARLGACRVSEPGRMAEPSMIWRHDGTLCIAELVRWCDVEMHPEAERPESARKG